jgi:hypothetical protein
VTDEQLITRIIELVGQTAEAQNRSSEILRDQTVAIRAIHSRRDLFNANLAASVIILIVLAISTTINIRASQSSGKIAQQNHQVVATFCATSPDLTECAVPGNDAAKAAEILANCRIYSNLAAASPAPFSLPTNEACSALGFDYTPATSTKAAAK